MIARFICSTERHPHLLPVRGLTRESEPLKSFSDKYSKHAITNPIKEKTWTSRTTCFW